MNLIVCVDKNGGIGNNNKLLMRIPEDMKQFVHHTTKGIKNAIIMGRKTYESLPKGGLPNRFNLVMTKSVGKHHPITVGDNVEFCSSKLEAVIRTISFDNVWVIGGEQIYNMFLDTVSLLYVTVIDHVFESDTKFKIPKNFVLVGMSSPRKYKDIEYSYRVYSRIESI